MIIESISIQNYGAFFGAHQFKLDKRGLVLVMGENLDEPRMKSNGAGKSTVFDALDWCLYGDIPRGDHVDSVVNEDAGVNTKVMVHLVDDDGTPYAVARWRGVKDAKTVKPNGAALFRGPDDLTALDDAETQRLIDRLLGVDREVFHALVLHAQTDTWNFASAKDAERVAILTKVLQLDLIDEWLERAKQRAQRLEFEVRGTEAKLAGFQAQAGELVNLDHTAKIAEWVGTHQQEVDAAQRLLDQATRGYEMVRGTVRDRKGLDEQLRQLRAQEPARPTYPAPPVRPERPPMPGTSPRPPRPASPDFTELRQQLANAATTIATAKADVLARRREVAALVQDAETFATKGQGVCGECRQPITAEHVAQEVHRLRNKANVVSLEAGKFEQLVKQWQEYEAGVQVTVRHREADYEQAVSYWEQELSQLDAVHREALRVYEEQVRQLDAVFEGTIAQHREIVQRLDASYTADFGVYSAAIARVQHEIRDVEQAERAVAQAKEGMERQRDRVESMRAQQNPWIAEQATLERRREEVQRAIWVSGEAVQTAKLNLRYAEFWIQALGPRGLKNFILDARVQEITDAANHWMRLIFGGTCWVRVETQTEGRSTGKLANKLNIRCFRYMPNGSIRERNFKSLSGGEKQRTSLAIDMGLSRIIASRATKRYDLLILDEVFKHLDSAGREAVVDLLHQLQAEKSSIFVVDHDQQFAGAFEHRVTVRKQNGRSVILEGIGSNDQDVGRGVSKEVGEAVQKTVPRRRPVPHAAILRR